MRAAVRIGRELAFQKPYDRYRKRELDPGPEIRSSAGDRRICARATVNDFHPGGRLPHRP